MRIAGCVSQAAYRKLRIAPKVCTAFNKCRLWGRETQPPTAQNHDPAKGETIMAKRIVTTLIALVLVFTALFPVGALSVVPMNDTPHEYSVLPGTDAWIEMSPEERRTATYVDQAEAENMTTRALLITTLGYPFLIDMYCIGYSSDCFLPGNTASALSNGIEIVAETFPPLKELLQRTDAVAEIDSLLEVIDEDTFRNGRMKALDLRQYIMSASAASPSYLVNPGGKPVTILKTPNGSNVYGIRDITWSDHLYTPSYSAALSQCEDYLDTYPGIALVANPAPDYNCHAYAWHSKTSIYWINDPSPYIRDGSYVRCYYAPVGSKITYQTSENSSYVHSGRITGTGGTVTSKWGELGVFRHSIQSCPYYSYANVIRYWKRSTN